MEFETQEILEEISIWNEKLREKLLFGIEFSKISNRKE